MSICRDPRNIKVPPLIEVPP
ncbi:Protein CBG26316 [Caenorhabditis briggsae]|uniref:Protein CBG26316 n=1 Tax=Caenorhabditis briggsae TaxID=6238 RepID=B6IG89_CAEBR|nr:Protein CBG26316 [Caenorhabditis briggsae]CAR98919.1 Protein CBG26316 [Caenorhabditis briggsae]